VAALTRRELRTPPDHGAPVFAVAIMVASAGLSWVFSGARGMWSAQPAIKIWCAACVSQGASRAAQGAIRPAPHGGMRSNKTALFCFCVGMAAELISSFEDYFQST
jgi:hypothetical protein